MEIVTEAFGKRRTRRACFPQYPSGPTTAVPAAGHRDRNRRARHVARTCQRRNTRRGLIGRIPLQQGDAQGVQEPKNEGQGESGDD